MNTVSTTEGHLNEASASPGTRSTCPYCGVGCGVVANRSVTSGLTITGDKEHPANSGRLCVKGSTLDQTQLHPDRLLQPIVNGETTDWSNALNRVAQTFAKTLDEHGPGAIAFYLSGQLLTEDYYVANKLMKGFLGSGNVDTNSRLCMSSAVAAYKRAFVEDVVPCDYNDLDAADLIVLVGSNTAWAHPIIYQRICAAQQTRSAKVVVIDPRRTVTAASADLHLPLAPGSDVALFNGLLAYLACEGAIDCNFIEQHTEGFEACLAVADTNPAATAAATGLTEHDLATFFSWFSATDRTVTLYSQGVNQSANGTDKANAIINCHLATGRVGRDGCGPFSITGQPNAMGGREVGGLANQLAAHMDFEPEHVSRVQRFWNAPRMATRPGLKAVEMFEAIDRGEIKAVWIMGTNPAVSLPSTDTVRRALARCPFVVVSDCVQHTDTNDYASVLLPACGWGEKDGTVTNSERCISRQRAFLTPTGAAKPDWWIVSEVGKRLGFVDAFSYTDPAEIFSEHAALTGFENNHERQLDLTPLADLSQPQYDALEPVQWPFAGRPYSDAVFSTPSHRARFLPTEATPPTQQPTVERPFIVNTGRIRDQWHTMTRTGVSDRLFQHRSLPFVELLALDAAEYQIEEGQLVELENDFGTYRGLARVTAGEARRQVFVPIHWSQQFASAATANSLIRPVTDPVSGQPESKHGTASLKKIGIRTWVRLVVPHKIAANVLATLDTLCEFRASIPEGAGFTYELALQASGHNLICELKNLTHVAQVVSFKDTTGGCAVQRAIGLTGKNPAWFIATALEQTLLPTARAMMSALDGTKAPWQQLSLIGAIDADNSPLVCTCFEVTTAAIVAAIDQGTRTPEALGKQLRCGTNCGSCVPELRSLITAATSANEA